MLKVMERFMFRGMEVKSRSSPPKVTTLVLPIGSKQVPVMSSGFIIPIMQSFSIKSSFAKQRNNQMAEKVEGFNKL